MIRAPARVIDAIRSFRLHSLYIRNFIISVSLIMLPLIGLNIFLYRVSRQMVTDEATALSQNTLSKTRDVLDSIIKEVDYLAASVELNSNTELFALSADPMEIMGQDVSRAIKAQLKTAVYSNPYIHSFYVFSEINNRILTHTGENEKSAFADDNWFEAYTQMDENRIYKVFRSVGDVYPYVISSIKPLYIFGREDKYGAIVVNVDVDELKRVLIDPDPNTPEALFVVDEGGTVIFSTRSEYLGKTESKLMGEMLSNTDASTIVSTDVSKFYAWKLVSIHSLETYSLQSARLRGILTGAVIVSLVATIIAAMLISGNAYRPIKRILAAIREPELVQTLESDEKGQPSNETRYIAATIARFTHTNAELRDELHKQLSALDRARSEALQIQINPHFLNNTLEVISMSARRLTSGANEVTRMVSLLSKLLQISLDTGDNLVPLSEEIEHAKLYLEILGLRYGDRFEVVWDIPDALLEHGMLKLALQPLIENAFYHGIKPTRSKGTITVSARLQSGELVTTVSNTGRGIPNQLITRLRRSLSGEYDLSTGHIGMRNVNQRAKLVFGPKYGVTIDSGRQIGTRVTIRIPVVQQLSRGTRA